MISEELTEQVKNREVAITDSKFCHAPWFQLHRLEMLIKHPLPFLLGRTPHTAGVTGSDNSKGDMAAG